MSTMTHTVVLTDERDGCTYERTYVDSADWSRDVYDLASYVMPGCIPHYADRRNSYGGGKASGPMFDQETGKRVGTYQADEIPGTYRATES